MEAAKPQRDFKVDAFLLAVKFLVTVNSHRKKRLPPKNNLVICPRKHSQDFLVHTEAAAGITLSQLSSMIADHVLNNTQVHICRVWGVGHNSIFVTCQNR